MTKIVKKDLNKAENQD